MSAYELAIAVPYVRSRAHFLPELAAALSAEFPGVPQRWVASRECGDRRQAFVATYRRALLFHGRRFVLTVEDDAIPACGMGQAVAVLAAFLPAHVGAVSLFDHTRCFPDGLRVAKGFYGGVAVLWRPEVAERAARYESPPAPWGIEARAVRACKELGHRYGTVYPSLVQHRWGPSALGGHRRSDVDSPTFRPVIP